MYIEIIIVFFLLLVIFLTFSYYVNKKLLKYPTRFYQDYLDNNECHSICPKNICNKYNWQLKAYKKCIRCKNKGYCSFPGDKPGKFNCKPCSDERFAEPCEKQYGCKNRHHKWYSPIDPKYTQCTICWEK